MMQPVTLRAHFDGQQILLDDPFPMEPNTKLVITVLPKDDEREDWTRLALESLERAYGDDEPDYSLGSLREENPDYERG